MVIDLVLIGLGITLEPFPLTAFILVLGAERGIIKGLAYILGWLACLVAVTAGVLLLTDGEPVPAGHRPVHRSPGRQAGRGPGADRHRGASVASAGPPAQAAGLDRPAGPDVAVGRGRAGRIPAALGAGRRRGGDDLLGQPVHRG